MHSGRPESSADNTSMVCRLLRLHGYLALTPQDRISADGQRAISEVRLLRRMTLLGGHYIFVLWFLPSIYLSVFLA